MSIFNSISQPRMRKSKFDLSHEKKISFNMGELIPAYITETLPGDSFRVNSEVFMRVQALLAPMMHRVDVTMHYFHVPMRLIWDESEDFFTGGRTGLTVPTAPYIELDNTIKGRFGVGTLPDYMGLPQMDTMSFGGVPVRISALPFRAYQLIYDEFYRDNTLTPPIACPSNSGAQGGSTVLDQHLNMRIRAWTKDYFTSARPSAQLGADVQVPSTNTIVYANQSTVKTVAGANANANTDIGTGTTAGLMNVNKTTLADGSAGRIENISQINTIFSINNFRRALAVQKHLEVLMRAGSRYTEFLKGVFNVNSDDARLQRPEYLGGGKQPLNISEVVQTAQGTNPVGTLNGMGYSVGNSNRFQRAFKEHGFVIGMLSVTPKPAYQQGISRMWTRDTRFDYYIPQFASIGEQEIKNKEIYLDPTSATTLDGTWGYTQRYGEYKYAPDSVHGEMKTSLAFWHQGQIYSALPPLNTNFIECKPSHRVFAVTDPNVDKLICQIYHKVDALRMMPYYSQPNI